MCCIEFIEFCLEDDSPIMVGRGKKNCVLLPEYVFGVKDSVCYTMRRQ